MVEIECDVSMEVIAGECFENVTDFYIINKSYQEMRTRFQYGHRPGYVFASNSVHFRYFS
jgi:hypothetical protein